MEKKGHRKYWLRGGIIGGLIPLFLFELFLILNSFGIAFGDYPVTALFIFVIAFIEFPAVIIGKILRFPIEASGDFLILYDLNAKGYVLTIIFWALIGLLIGYIVEIRKAKLT